MDPLKNIEEWYKNQVDNLSSKPEASVWDSLDNSLSGNIPNIEDWYKTQVENQSLQPDSNVWENLSGQLDSEIPVEEWYKKGVEGIDLEPSDSIIENIFHSLDVDSVWDRLLVTLHKRDRFIWWRNFTISSLTGIGLIILGFLLLPEYLNYSLPDLKESKGNNTFRSTNNSAIAEINHNEFDAEIHATDGSDALITNAPTTNNHQTTNHVSYQNNHTDNGVNQEFTGSTTTPVPDKQVKRDFVARNTINPTIFHPAISGEIDLIIDQPDLSKNESKRPIFLLAGVGLDHSILLNENSRSAFNINSTDYNQAVASSILSIGLGLPLNDQLTMEASISKLSQGHQFVLYREGLTTQHKMKLNYIQGSVLAKIDRTNRYPVWNGQSLFGMYYSFLTSDESMINNVEVNDNIEFKNYDIGLIAGYEIEKSFDRYNLGISLYYNQGITNILDQNLNNNYSFNQTINSGLNAKVQISVPIR